MDFDDRKMTNIHTPHHFKWSDLKHLYIRKIINYNTFVHRVKLIETINYINLSFFNEPKTYLYMILVLMEEKGSLSLLPYINGYYLGF